MNVRSAFLLLLGAAVASFAALLLLGACASPTAPVATATPKPAVTTAATPPDANTPFRSLLKGMTTAQVRAWVGSPAKVEPVNAAGITGEIWVYYTTTYGPTEQVAADLREVPFFDPISGNMKMIKEPVYRTQVTRFEHTFELLMIRNLLVEWKHEQTVHRGIH